MHESVASREQPRSGERMKPPAQAVGASRQNGQAPKGAKDNSLLHPEHGSARRLTPDARPTIPPSPPESASRPPQYPAALPSPAKSPHPASAPDHASAAPTPPRPPVPRVLHSEPHSAHQPPARQYSRRSRPRQRLSLRPRPASPCPYPAGWSLPYPSPRCCPPPACCPPTPAASPYTPSDKSSK